MVGRTRKRVIKQFATVGTQTDVPNQINTNIVVNIKPLNEDEVHRMISKQRDVQTPERTFKGWSKNVGTSVPNSHMNVRQSVSRLPSNYKNFVRPINNNEVANSTVVNITHTDEEQSASSHNEENTDLDMARYIKPGPKSYKMRMFRKMHNLRAPAPLSTPKTNNYPAEQNYLTTVAEATAEGYITTPVLQQIVCVDANEISLNRQRIGDGSAVPLMGSKSQLEMCGVITTEEEQHAAADCNVSEISSHTSNKGCGNTKTGNDNHNAEETKQEKYIRINAQTVHIHNHFYKV